MNTPKSAPPVQAPRHVLSVTAVQRVAPETRLPAIAVCGPYGAVKEQSSGLYAQEMAERGFLAIAFDPSTTGESGGSPRYMTSPSMNSEDFMAAVDYLSNREDVDAERIGGVVDPVPDDAPDFVKGYYSYYKTKRGYHPRSLNSTDGWMAVSFQELLNQPILAWASEIANPVLMIHGSRAHSLYFSQDAYKKLTGDNKELPVIPGATHTDLYDNFQFIPFERIASFFDESL